MRKQCCSGGSAARGPLTSVVCDQAVRQSLGESKASFHVMFSFLNCLQSSATRCLRRASVTIIPVMRRAQTTWSGGRSRSLRPRSTPPPASTFRAIGTTTWSAAVSAQDTIDLALALAFSGQRSERRCCHRHHHPSLSAQPRPCRRSVGRKHVRCDHRCVFNIRPRAPPACARRTRIRAVSASPPHSSLPARKPPPQPAAMASAARREASPG